ncbi:MAG: hypothetical protein IPK76_02995 [Lewinellaceae bacterium]|nr:hypothetical protein [Lewinellaceae bacterium]
MRLWGYVPYSLRNGNHQTIEYYPSLTQTRLSRTDRDTITAGRTYKCTYLPSFEKMEYQLLYKCYLTSLNAVEQHEYNKYLLKLKEYGLLHSENAVFKYSLLSPSDRNEAKTQMLGDMETTGLRSQDLRTVRQEPLRIDNAIVSLQRFQHNIDSISLLWYEKLLTSIAPYRWYTNKSQISLGEMPYNNIIRELYRVPMQTNTDSTNLKNYKLGAT